MEEYGLLDLLSDMGFFWVLLVIVFIGLFLHFVPLRLWIAARAANVSLNIITLVGMRMRQVVPSKIVLPLIKANKAGLDVEVNQLEAHFLAGGNVDKVVDALIAAHRAQIPLPFERSAAIDLAGRDVLEAVQMSVNPKVIETPVVSAVARNGIELKIKARVTVRANIDRLVGGAGESLRLLPVLVRVLLPLLVPLTAIMMYWLTQMIFPRLCWARAWMQVLPLRFCPLILPMWM